MKLEKIKKPLALINVLINYLVAIYVGYYAMQNMSFSHPIISLLFADIVATFVVFLGSCIFVNASVYDPYWSVAPIIFLIYWTAQSNTQIIDILRNGYIRPTLVWIVVIFWGFRLTGNWIRGFTGFNYEDWRYQNFRKQFPKMFWLINLLGIQLFPTIIVFLGSLSLYPALTAPDTSINIMTVIGVLLCVGAVILEWKADNQMWTYRKERTPEQSIIQTGLWRKMRHPNYIGEMLFWWGLYIIALGVSIQFWWMIIGPLAISLMFLFISIPMIEKHQESKKPAYTQYKKEVPILVPNILKRKL